MLSLDGLIGEFDRALRAIAGVAEAARRSPAEGVADAELSADERDHAAALMRVNHVGEVCAQALYSAQALATADPALRRQFERAAGEETDHLAWTA
jgi:ubiquinone biosynthesis monooxygenase Coq7